MLTIGKTRGFSSSNSDFRFRLRRTSILENPRTHNLQFQTRPCMDTEGTHDIYSIDQPWDQDIKIPGIHSYFEHSACTNNTMDCWFHRFIIMSRLDIWLSHLDHFGSVGVFVFIGMATSCSNLWSCASLQEGVDHTMGQCFHPDEEADLLKELQDLKHVSILQHFHVSLRYIWMIYDWSSYVCFNFTMYIYIYAVMPSKLHRFKMAQHPHFPGDWSRDQELWWWHPDPSSQCQNPRWYPISLIMACHPGTALLGCATDTVDLLGCYASSPNLSNPNNPSGCVTHEPSDVWGHWCGASRCSRFCGWWAEDGCPSNKTSLGGRVWYDTSKLI